MSGNAELRPAGRAPHRALWLEASSRPEALSLEATTALYLDLCAQGPPPDAELCAVVERNLQRTYPTSPLFALDGETVNSLRRVLHAYARLDPDVGYVQGMNFLVGFLLHFFESEAEVFAMLVRLMEHPRYRMRQFFVVGLPEVEILRHVVAQLLQRHLPVVARHMEAVGCDTMFFFEWHLTLFTYTLPLDEAAEVWDEFFTEGWAAMFRVMVVLLRELQDALVGSDLNGTVRALKSYQAYRTSSECPDSHADSASPLVASPQPAASPVPAVAALADAAPLANASPLPEGSPVPAASPAGSPVPPTPADPYLWNTVWSTVSGVVGSVTTYFPSWPSVASPVVSMSPSPTGTEEDEWCRVAFHAPPPRGLVALSRCIPITAEEVEALRQEAALLRA